MLAVFRYVERIMELEDSERRIKDTKAMVDQYKNKVAAQQTTLVLGDLCWDASSGGLKQPLLGSRGRSC